MPKKKTLEEVIADFRKAHGDRYDYSKVEYVNAKTKVLIICQDHGEFWQRPGCHKKGRGCAECGGTNLLTTQQVIKKFRKIHGERYDYSKIIYKNAKNSVKIICPEHGCFIQNAHSHMKGRGCPKCANNVKKTNKEILHEFRKIHGERYDYSKVDYNGSLKKIIITCPEHGDFEQIAIQHKRGNGCPKCSGVCKKTNKEILHEFRKIHGERYDYSKVDYKNTHSKIIIVCPVHGEFNQTRHSHRRGQGCPKCNDLKSEPLFREVLEEVMSRFGKFEFPKIRPDWLKNPETGKSLEIDCFNEELEIGFELQGAQHYKPIKHWGGEKAFARTIRRDNHKLTECRKRGVYLFKIDNRPTRGWILKSKKKYYEKQIRKCLNKAPKDVKLKLLNANKKE
jgi:hypothetical protein